MTLEFQNQINIQPTEEGGGGGGGSDSIGIPRELNNGVLQMPSGSFSLPTGTTDLGDFALYYAFAYASGITSVDLSKLTTISGQHGLSSAFYHAGVQNVDISNLVTITGDYGMNSTFNTNPNLQTVEFPKLVSIGKRAFSNAFSFCSGLTSLSFPELTTISGESGFGDSCRSCTGLTVVTFPKLTSLSENAMRNCFENCTGITDVYFPALTTSSFPSGVGYGNTPLKMFNNACKNVKIHLPSNLSSITWINSSSREQYFGSDYCTVLLDLPATS